MTSLVRNDTESLIRRFDGCSQTPEPIAQLKRYRFSVKLNT